MLDTLREALDVDSSIHTHPVSVKVRNPAEINEIVDKITYHKVSYISNTRYSVSSIGISKHREECLIYLLNRNKN